MPEYEEHPSKAAAIRSGEIVTLPDADAADATVWFAYEADKWEGLLARTLAPDRARICAVPFCVYDVNLGDEVAVVASAEGVPVAVSTVEDAGNLTFRVIFEGASDDDGRWRELMEDLEPHHCWFDARGPRLVAVSAPPSAGQQVADYLATREARGELLYETGRTAA